MSIETALKATKQSDNSVTVRPEYFATMDYYISYLFYVQTR